MIDALVTGKLQGAAASKTSKNGNAFVTAKVRASSADGDVFVNVIAFAESVGRALLALGDGEVVAIAGTLTPKAWTDKTGAARPALDLQAHDVLTKYHAKKRREAVTGGAEGQAKPTKSRPNHFDDGLDDGAPLDF